ncbi:MAG: SET domain-containing protein-lysine N-methyltransferase [Gemmatimonadetes bacterium]|nr:SET domain-containing protein-lysine N-methyltransferase [Gemmatimonadota bacterium]
MTSTRTSTRSRPTPRATRTPAAPVLHVVRRSAIQGRGVFAKVAIAAGTRIIEYTGEHITHAVADSRYDDAAMARHHTFLFTLNRRTVVDGAVGGSDARYINHSCAPNCEAVIDGAHIWIEALRDIAAGEELSYDYGYERDGTETAEDEARYACRCGAPTCRGTILAPKKPVAKLPHHAKARHTDHVAG